MHKIITLINGSKVKLYSDNDDCTLQVFDTDIIFNPESTYLTTINYAIVSIEDRKELSFYKSESNQSINDELFSAAISANQYLAYLASEGLINDSGNNWERVQQGLSNALKKAVE